MSFWIQHSYGKGDKIERLRDASLLDGVVLSPADEEVAALTDLSEDLRSEGVEVMVDPQSYVYSIAGTGRLHEKNGIVLSDMQWSESPKTVEQHVAAVLSVNKRVKTDGVIAPSPLQSAFLDYWAPVAMQYARTTTEQAKGRPVFASLVIDEAAFGEWDAAEQWLDVASQLDVAGFYVVLSRSDSQYPVKWDPIRLCNLLRLVYRLVQNEYKVLVGYTDMEALALASVGAATATGWFYSQRRFTESKWRPSTGGRSAIPRILSETLLVPVQAQETIPVLRSRFATKITTDTEVRSAILAQQWGLSQSRQQHLNAMGRLVREMSEGATPDRVKRATERFSQARSELTKLGTQGLLVETPGYVRVVRSIEEALRCFAKEELPA